MKRKPCVRMLGYKIDIEYVDDLQNDQGEKLHGEFDADAMCLRVDNDLDDSSLESTILHELIHAALELTGHRYRMSEKEEEALTRGLERALISAVKLR